MRAVVDSEVKKFFENRPLERLKFSEYQKQFSGNVVKTNDFEYLPASKMKAETVRERLLSAMSRMPGNTDKEKYCFAMISLANLGSVYLSTAIQYSLYYVLTTETKPISVEDYIKDAGQTHLLSVIDMDVLTAFIKDILKGYDSLKDVETKAEGDDLIDIATNI